MSLTQANTNQQESKTSTHKFDTNHYEPTQSKRILGESTRINTKPDTSLPQVNLSQLISLLCLAVSQNQDFITNYRDIQTHTKSLLIFLFQYNVCTAPDSYHIAIDFVLDMPSVYTGMIFASDWSCDKTFFNAFLIIEHILMV